MSEKTPTRPAPRRKAPPDDPIMSVTDVVDMIGVPRDTIYIWRHHGVGPQGFKIGRHLKFRRSEINRWLAEHGDTAANGAR